MNTEISSLQGEPEEITDILIIFIGSLLERFPIPEHCQEGRVTSNMPGVGTSKDASCLYRS